MQDKHLYEFGRFRLDAAERLLLRDGQPVPLTPKAFETLLVLIERSPRLVEKDELIKQVWSDAFVEEGNLTHNVWTLRKALGEDQTGQKYIETVPKRGYRFVARVKEVPDESAELIAGKRATTRIISEKEVSAEDKAAQPHSSGDEMIAKNGMPAEAEVSKDPSSRNGAMRTARGIYRLDCSRCQTINFDSAKFCSNCGMAFARRCFNCGMELPSAARFCMGCGQQASTRTSADDARFHSLAAPVPAPLADKMRAAARLAGERKPVTVLLVDVLGSMSSVDKQIDTEDWATVINRAFDRFAQVVYRYEGTLARLLGDSLLAFFGAPVAHEDDPVRAVRAALDVLAVARGVAAEVRQEYGIELTVWVGLNTGPVVVGAVGSDLKYEYTALGETVNLAARIQSSAHSMTVLITEYTCRLVAPIFDCADLGLIEVKGKIEPVHLYEVRGPKTQLDRVRGLAGLESPMVGRDAELTALQQLTRAVCAGLGRVAVIIGEPGIGKTRLVSEWKAPSGANGLKLVAQDGIPARARERNFNRHEIPSCDTFLNSMPLPSGAARGPTGDTGLQWAVGHCLSYGQGQAYHLLLNLLRSLIGVPAASGEPETHTALRSLTEELFGDSAINVYPYLGHLLSLQLEGEALERVRLLDPQALQTKYLAALQEMLRTLAARRPLALIFEDIHWIDPSSTDLLTKLLPLAAEAPLLFCFVTRPDRDAEGWKLVTAARDHAGTSLTELSLNALSEADSGELVANLLRIKSLPEHIRELIIRKAEGNPFFVEEVIRMLIDRGAIIKEGESWVIGREIKTAEIPDNLQALLLARIDRLPDNVKHTLRVAAVIGRQFPVKLLEQVLR